MYTINQQGLSEYYSAAMKGIQTNVTGPNFYPHSPAAAAEVTSQGSHRTSFFSSRLGVVARTRGSTHPTFVQQPVEGVFSLMHASCFTWTLKELNFF